MMRRSLALLLSSLLGIGLLIALVAGVQAGGRADEPVPPPGQAPSAPVPPVRADESLSLPHAVFLPIIGLHRPPYEMRINVGGPLYTTTQGIVYQADQLYTPGNRAGYLYPGNLVKWYNALGHPLGGSANGDKWLYADARADFGEYRFDVPNDDYLVTLQMAALRDHAPGQRVFDVSVESSPILTDLDLFAEANLWYAVDVPVSVAVTDGQLNVVFSPTVGSPMLNAIVVTNQVTQLITPTPPTEVRATGCFDRILVDWQASDEPATLGYQVRRSDEISVSQVVTSGLRYVPYYLDDDVAAGQTYSYSVRTRDATGRASGVSAAVTASLLPPTSTALPVYELIVAPQDLEALNANPWTDDYVPARFRYDGVEHEVEVRYRGAWTSREAPKKSFKIRFPETQLFQQHRVLNLNAEFNDPYLLREKMAYDLFQQFGVDGSQAQHVHLRLNGQFWGVYTQVEHVDEYLLLRSGRPVGSTIYQVGPYGDFSLLDDPDQYAKIYPKRTNQGGSYNELIAMLQVVNNTPDEQFPNEIVKLFKVDDYLHYYGTVILTGNHDVMEYFHNAFMIHNVDTGLWEVIPWDNGGAFGFTTLPIDHGTPQHVLLTRLLDVPEFRLYYSRFLIEAMDGEFSPEQIEARVDSHHTLIGMDSQCDTWHRYWWHPHLPGLRPFVERRNAYIQSVVYSFTEGLTLPLTLDLAPAGDRLALSNRGLLDWDVGGMTVHSGQDSWRLPEGTIVPAKGTLVLWDAQTKETNLLTMAAETFSTADSVTLFDKPVHGPRAVSRWTRRSERTRSPVKLWHAE